MWVDSASRTVVPNTQLVLHEDYDYHLVGSEGVIAECAPGLAIKDLAEYVIPCYEIEGGLDTWTYIEACEYRKIGWLQQDSSLNVGQLVDSISGISDQVTLCTTSAEKKRGKSARTTNEGKD